MMRKSAFFLTAVLVAGGLACEYEGGLGGVSKVVVVTIPQSATEGDDVLAGRGRVSIPLAVDADLIVNLLSSDAGELSVPATVTITAGATSATFDLTVGDDTDVDGTQTVTVTAFAVDWKSGARTIDILDDEPVPTVEWLAADQSVGEGEGTVTVTATLSATCTYDVSVPYAVSGTAANPDDHNLADGSIDILATNLSNSVTFDVVDDTLQEGNEEVVLTMGTPTGATAGATTVHTVTILDNDGVLTVVWSAAAQAVAEGDGTATVTATLSGLAGAEVTVPFTVSGTAAPADHDLADGSIVIAIGNSEGSVTLSIVDDALDEDDETVVVTMGAPTGAIQGATTVHTVTITDDDPRPSVEWSSASQDVGEDVGTVTVTATLSPVSGRDVTVPYTVGGDATNPADHNLVNGDLLITAGSTSGSLQFAVVDDGLAEVDERVTLTIGTPVNAAKGATDVHAVVILDNDAPDLVMTALTGPASANTGQDIDLTNTVRNIGGGDAGSFEVRFYISADTSIVPGFDPPLGSRSLPGLAASGTSSTITVVTVPTSIPNGAYYIGGIVDAFDSVAESDETNNTFVSGGTIDIGSTGIGMDAYEPDNTYDEANTIVVDGSPQAHTLHVVGDRDWLEIPISGPMTIVIETYALTDNVETMLFLYDSDGTTLLAENRDGGAEFGAGKIVWTFAASTTCYVKVKHPWTWGNPGGYDISVTTFTGGGNVDLQMDWVGVWPENAMQGGIVQVELDIRNLGASASPPFRLGWYMSNDAVIVATDTLMDSMIVPGLAAGEWMLEWKILTIPLARPDGDVWFGGIVDDLYQVDEGINEGNNALAANNPVGIGMDIQLSVITVPPTANEGAMISIDNTVYNNGGCSLNNVNVEIYLSPDADIDQQSDQWLGNRWINGPIAPGISDTDVTSVWLPGLMGSGTYYIGVVAYKQGMGPWEWAPEKDYTNNILSEKIDITGSNWPDLVITKATVTPLTVDPNDNLDVTDVTENAGSVTTGVGSDTGYHLAADPEMWWGPNYYLGSRPVPTLGPGASSSGGATVTVPLGTYGGTFYLLARADDNWMVAEFDDNNNTLAAADMVSVSGPDMDESWNDTMGGAGMMDPWMCRYPRPYTFHVAGDVDWFELSFFGPGTYTIETSNLLFGADTVLALYKGGEETPLMTDDDGGTEPRASKVTFDVTDMARYYVLVTHASNGTGHYKIQLRQGL